MQWRDAKTADKRKELLAAALAEHGSIRAAARALGTTHTTIRKALRASSGNLAGSGNPGNPGSQVSTGNHECESASGNPVSAESLTESPAAPILGGMDAAISTVAAAEGREDRPLTSVRLSHEPYVLFQRLTTELNITLRREPTQGEVVTALLRYASRQAAPQHPAPAPVLAAALAPFLEVRS